MNRALSRAARLREIETLLFHHSQGMRITEIAELCGVDRRTIYRDIDLLGESDVPIWQEDGKYGIIRDQYLATVRLSFNEAVALYIASRLLARHADEHNPYNISALKKLATAFPDPMADYINRTAEALRNRPVNPVFAQVLDCITSCWIENKKVRLWYRSPRSGIVRERDFATYTIEPSTTGGLYVIGYDDWADDIRTFKFDRLERAQMLPESYMIPEDFNPKTHLADAWGIMSGTNLVLVKLRFSPNVATLIQERIWHSSQTLKENDDGFIELSVEVADEREMRPWIRSWGAEVEVLAPEKLRNDLILETHHLAKLYKTDITPDNDKT